MQMPWLEIGLVLLLVVINAAFAGSEVALISLREGQLRRLEQEGEQGRLVALVSTLTRPAVWLLSRSTDVLVRLAGADPRRQREEVTEEEVRDMIATGSVFRPEQRRILAETIEIGERRGSGVAVPPGDVLALPPQA